MDNRGRWVIGLGGLAAVWMLAGCVGTSRSEDGAVSGPGWRMVSLAEESVERAEASTLVVERGMIEVPGVRDGGTSETLEVEFFRFRRKPDAPRDTPPVFYLKGGPGFEGMRPLLERPGYFEKRLAPYLEVSDLVIVGQRGFGTSTDTACPASAEIELPREQWLDVEARSRARREAAIRCRDYWLAQGVDLASFTVVEAAADVRDVAVALGYEKVLLWGSSFGAHWGMAIMRNHPEVVARAVFNALEGPDHTFDMPSGVLGALERIAAAAEASPAFRDALPEGGLWAGFARQIARAEAAPITVTVTDPDTGEPTEVTFDADDIRDLARGYRARPAWRDVMPRWLPDLYAVATGDLEPAASAVLRRGGWIGVDAAAFDLYNCGSGISPARDARRRADPAVAVLGVMGRSYDDGCPVWDSDLGPAFRSDFETEIPTVLVHGTWDASTPYENALDVAPFFSQGHLVTVEGGSHGAIFEAVEEVEGFKEALWHFAKTGDATPIPDRVTLPPIAWQPP